MAIDVRSKFVEHISVIADSFMSFDLDGSRVAKEPAWKFVKGYAQIFFGINNFDIVQNPPYKLSRAALQQIISYFQRYDHNSIALSCVFRVLDCIATSRLERNDRAIATLFLGLDSFVVWCFENKNNKHAMSVQSLELVQSIIIKFYGEVVRFGKQSLLDLGTFCDKLELPLSPETNYLFKNGEAELIGTPAVAQFHDFDLEEPLFGILDDETSVFHSENQIIVPVNGLDLTLEKSLRDELASLKTTLEYRDKDNDTLYNKLEMLENELDESRIEIKRLEDLVQEKNTQLDKDAVDRVWNNEDIQEELSQLKKLSDAKDVIIKKLNQKNEDLSAKMDELRIEAEDRESKEINDRDAIIVALRNELAALQQHHSPANTIGNSEQAVDASSPPASSSRTDLQNADNMKIQERKSPTPNEATSQLRHSQRIADKNALQTAASQEKKNTEHMPKTELKRNDSKHGETAYEESDDHESLQPQAKRRKK